MKTLKIKNILAAILSVAVISSAGCGGSAAQTTTSGAAATADEAVTTTAAESTTAETTTTAASENDTSAEETEAPTETAEQSEESTSSNAGSIDAASLIPADIEVTPALWKATVSASGNSIFLMGSFHAVPDGTYPLPDYIEEVYTGSDIIAVEYDTDKITDAEQLDMADANTYATALMYTDGSLLSDHISEDTYNAVTAFADANLGGWNPLYDYYNVGFWISTISSYQVTNISGFDFTQGIDRYFVTKAKADGKTVRDIEAITSQTDALTAYSDALGDYVISDSLSSIGESDEMAQTLADMYCAWASGDVSAFESLNSESEELSDLPAELESDYQAYMDTVYGNRNKGMADKAAEYITNGDNVFFIVGFAHFAGDDGVPALLEDMGYTVEKLY